MKVFSALKDHGQLPRLKGSDKLFLITLLTFSFIAALNIRVEHDPPLKVSLSFPQSIYISDELVVAVVRLENISDEPIEVNGQMLLSALGGIWFSIWNANGEHVSILFSSRTLPLLAENVLLLHPGEQIVKDYKLSGNYGFGAGGEFRDPKRRHIHIYTRIIPPHRHGEAANDLNT